MSLAQVQPMRAILERIHGLATDADAIGELVYFALMDSATLSERIDLKISAARDELKRIDALLVAASQANSPTEAMREVAEEMRVRVGGLIGAIKIESATVAAPAERGRT